jgi:hypothetical protein
MNNLLFLCPEFHNLHGLEKELKAYELIKRQARDKRQIPDELLPYLIKAMDIAIKDLGGKYKSKKTKAINCHRLYDVEVLAIAGYTKKRAREVIASRDCIVDDSLSRRKREYKYQMNHEQLEEDLLLYKTDLEGLVQIILSTKIKKGG